MQEVIVTAQKRSESVQRVAAAVSVVDSAKLTNAGVTDLTTVSNLASGLSITPVRTQAFIFIRGVGQTLTSPNADAAVAVNLNGVYLPAEIAGTAFFDVDRVEILRGPQGTLYGRNSTGGVVNIASRMPGDKYGVDGFVEVGNYNRFQVVGGVNIPLTDDFRSRTAVTVVKHDGYFNNGEDDQDSYAVRQTFVWTPSDRTKITAVGSYGKDGGIGNVLQNIPFQECGERCATFNPQALGYGYSAKTYEGSLQVSHQLNDTLGLTYIGGYNRLNLRTVNSIFTGPPLGPLRIDERIESQSHEGRLNISLPRLQGIVGLYYYDQSSYYRQDAQPTAAQRLINPFNGDGEGSAVFGQATYTLTDALRLTAGLRYSHNEKSISGFNSTYNAAGAQILLRPFAGSTSLNRTDWKVGVEYDLAPAVMLYGNVSTGFSPGGFSTGPAVVGQLPAAQFKEVTLLAYAGGVKSRVLDNRLTLNLEGFYYDYDNYQVSARDLLTAQNLVFNAAKATVYGAQLDANARPTDHDTLSFSATYLHAVADTLRTPGAIFDGFDLPYSPKWTVNAFYQHAFDVGSDGAQIRGSINFKYASGRWALYTHAPGFYIKSNTHTDLNLGYYAPDDRWSIQAFVRNAEDELVKTSCGNAIPGLAGCFFEPPRTYGLTLSFKG
jgi:iron complex outermembrane receptor protein